MRVCKIGVRSQKKIVSSIEYIVKKRMRKKRKIQDSIEYVYSKKIREKKAGAYCIRLMKLERTAFRRQNL